jgi:hypothetical protein
LPDATVARGVELSVRAPLSESVHASASLVWSNVIDEFRDADMVRSWDQPLAFTTGLSWTGARTNVSVLAGWHSGWPRTPIVLQTDSNSQVSMLEVGGRSSARWSDYWTIDLRASWHRPLAIGDFAMFIELTNSTSQLNKCCTLINSTKASGQPFLEINNWLPRLINLGFAVRWTDP